MGQTQSQESESASPPESEPDDQEFDISQIPDDRDHASAHNSDAGPDRTPAPAPDESAGMAKRSGRHHRGQTLAVTQSADASRRKSKKRSRKRRLSQNIPSDDALSEVPNRKSPPLTHATEIKSDSRPLRDTEPETYHIYATSDASDAEDADSQRLVESNAFAAVNGGSQKDGEAFGVPATQVPPLRVNDEGRVLCPLAEVHNCKLTFGSGKAATRHANVHTTSFQCGVCGKQMSRKDTLAKHMKLHSALQIASAEAFSKPNEDPLAKMPESSESAQRNVSNEVHTQVEDGEPPEEDSIEFTTHPEKLGSKDHGHNLDLDPQPEGNDGLEVEMNEAPPDADVAEVVSDQQSSSPSSVFDEAEDIIVKETPMRKGNLKRKRDAGDGPQPKRPSPERTRKRRKGTPNSPPTSVPPNETTKPDSLKSGVADALQSRQVTDKIVPRLQKRQGSMNGWAQKYTPGSGLRHPTLNPKSPPSRSVTQRMEVVIPKTSQAGPSSMKSKKKDLALADAVTGADRERSEANALAGLSRKKLRKAPYATPKGKRRAEPDVDYSTPLKDSAGGEVDVSNSGSDNEPVGIATSVAKRTFPAPIAQKQGQEEHDDSDVDADPTNRSDVDLSEAESAERIDRVTKAPRSKRSDNGDSLECTKCHRRFANRDLLNKHLKKRSAHVGLHKCLQCSEEFWATTALAQHEKDMGHGKGNGLQGRTGAFSQTEVAKLNGWRDRFCEHHNISRIQFNDMMTDTMTRDKGSSWNWPFIKRAEFLQEYLGVLPNRNKRSLLRYRERNFQNVEGSKNWTAEDDKDLIRLHKELGPKWAEIAKRLTRTLDAVSQRWRHKLRYGEVDTGEWSKAENAKFREILDELRHDSDGKELQDYRIPWNQVSERMGTRSAQQCSNHYRARHSKKERGRWIKIDALEKSLGSSRILTPSKMELRLSGKTVRTRTSKKGLSEEYILDDDDDEDGDEGPEEGQGDDEASENDKLTEGTTNEDTGSERGSDSEGDVEVANQSSSSAEDGSPASEISHTRIPVITKTPGKTLGSSQLFEQTQANTSALKPPQTSGRKARLQESQERPSPNIPIEQRRLESRSPLKEIPVLENGDLAPEQDDDEDESKSGMSDNETSDDRGSAQQTDEEQDITSEGSANEDEDVVVDTEAAETEDDDDDDSDDDNPATTDEDTDEDDGGDDGDNVDEESSPEDEEDGEDEDSEASGENKSSFMDSINESAKRAMIRSSQTLKGLPVPGIGGRNKGKLHKLDQEGSDDEE
ncbi:uncharacterized protein PV07_07781 [Cladophialophora immunda]|uniref:Uncharacterized protein n=1 Tax=Cladophialophora immunda TaxID=569365 RepID=A0A0D1ZJE3_9EURO|nr:uncharacterized protein PV07_07781 [Cladophialophora immunda]KIW28096.1 hypothetical protein PV07_07781 [Cladophialophora immunda]